MLLLAFLEAMAAMLVTSGGIPLSESQIGPAAMVFPMFSCLFQALSMEHDPTRSLSSRTVKKLNLVFEQLDDVQMMRQCFAFGGSLRRRPRRYI